MAPPRTRDCQAAPDLHHQTIADFGEQWTAYPDNEGYYGSAALFNDVFGPLLSAGVVKDKRVCEIGAGKGRFVNIFADHGAAHVAHPVAVVAEAALVRREDVRAHGEAEVEHRELEPLGGIVAGHHDGRVARRAANCRTHLPTRARQGDTRCSPRTTVSRG